MFNRLFAFVLLAVGFATAARADYIPATWIDNANVGSGVYIGDFQSYTYNHDIRDNGFRPLNDVISGFHLSINLADDRRGLELPELAFIDLPGLGGDGLVHNFGLAGEEFGGWSILGLLQLNVLGTLTVTISSIMGDFNLVGSTLTAHGYQNVASVPEPGALGLLGIGLMGMALSMRRRKLRA
ncbi:MAG: PEP-CTERM sorting domain-containing protein [Steroidobacter sp.]